MKKLIIVILIGIGIWWGFKHFSGNSDKGQGSGGTTQGHGTSGAIISEGEKIDLAKYLVPGKYTVFFFYANW